MNGRNNRIKNWLEIISADLSNIDNIFTSGLISENDIGKIEKEKILEKINDLINVIDDVIFNLDGRK